MDNMDNVHMDPIFGQSSACIYSCKKLPQIAWPYGPNFVLKPYGPQFVYKIARNYGRPYSSYFSTIWTVHNDGLWPPVPIS